MAYECAVVVVVAYAPHSIEAGCEWFVVAPGLAGMYIFLSLRLQAA
jgi:hypothetical protein